MTTKKRKLVRRAISLTCILTAEARGMIWAVSCKFLSWGVMDGTSATRPL